MGEATGPGAGPGAGPGVGSEAAGSRLGCGGVSGLIVEAWRGCVSTGASGWALGAGRVVSRSQWWDYIGSIVLFRGAVRWSGALSLVFAT